MKRILSIFVMVIIVIFAFAVTPKKKRVHQLTPINIEASVDSALIMADNYATALATTPEMAPTRLNMFKIYCTAKPKMVQDTICSRIFDFFVQYVGSDKVERATAFKNCYEAISSTDDVHRGPLYTMELRDAIVNSDTIKINHYLPLLEDYANCMNFDYDEEILNANQYLKSIRERRPINEAFAGIWVSEDIVGVINGEKYTIRAGDQGNHYSTTQILQIRNRESPIYDGSKEVLNSFDKYKFNTEGINSKIDVFKGHLKWIIELYNYNSIQEWETPAFSYEFADSLERYNALDHHSLSYIEDVLNDDIKKTLASYVVEDPNSQSIYVYWGDERLRRNNPEISAAFRQLTQNTQSFVTGELTRSKYSTADRILGNLTSTLVSGAIDHLITNLSVSTDKIWSVEMTLKMVNPRHLIADISTHVIVSKSNEEQPRAYDFSRHVNYYRWEPNDSVGFINLTIPLGDATHPDEYIFHHKVSKKVRNKNIAAYKEYKNRFKKWKNEEYKRLKAELSKHPKNSEEYNKIRKYLKDYVKDLSLGGYMCPEVQFNMANLKKLKYKAENYKP